MMFTMLAEISTNSNYYGSYYGGGFYGIGYSSYFLVILGAILCFAASAHVNSTFSRYSKVRSKTGLTGKEVAERMLSMAGIYDVRVEPIRGNLTDHYDPKSKVLRLSEPVYNQCSVAAIGVAAHECGHAIQHKEEYQPLMIRGAIVPVVNFGSQLAWPLIIVGCFIGHAGNGIIWLGILLFSLSVLFQLVTLPVEINASKRAIRVLDQSQMLYQDEVPKAKKVLKAAAYTYVASAVAIILQLLRLVLIFGNRGDRD